MTVTGKSSSSGTHYWRAWKSGQIWNGSAYEDYLLANYASYDITATSEGLGIFTGSVPDDTDFAELVYQSGGSPAAGDDVEWIFEAGTAAAGTDNVQFKHGGVEFR